MTSPPSFSPLKEAGWSYYYEHTRARTSSHVLQRDSVLGCGVASACQADRLGLTAWSEGCRRGEKGTDFRTLQTTKTNSLPGREPPSAQNHQRCSRHVRLCHTGKEANPAPVDQPARMSRRQHRTVKMAASHVSALQDSKLHTQLCQVMDR